MTTEMTCSSEEHRNFRVDMGGIVTLLSKNLYSSPGVFVRELLQNACDAIAAREALGHTVPRGVTISPVGVASPGSPEHEFAISDSGIGVRPDEVEVFLGTVGASSKREDVQHARGTFIGQFGVGLLSCFLVTDEIVVLSRSATQESPIEWIGRSDGTYEVRMPDGAVPVGTTVRFRPRPDAIGWARWEQVVPLVQRYAEFLPAEIVVLGPQGASSVSRHFPWLPDFGAHRDDVIRRESPWFGGTSVGVQTDVIRVVDHTLQLDAVVYVGAPWGRSRTARRNRVYVNDMLVTDTDDSLLPSWAFFAWCVVRSTALEVTASREALVANRVLAATCRQLGRALLGWLQRLADTDPERFEQFVAEHAVELRQAATQGYGRDRLDLAEVVLPMLRVQTTGGEMRIADVVHHSPQVAYAASVDDFRTIASTCPPGRLVVNAGHTLDQEVLRTLPDVIPGLTVRRVVPGAELAALAPVADVRATTLALFASGALRDQRCEVVVRQFPSPDLPAVYVEGDGAGRVGPDWGHGPHLVLNWSNRVVRALEPVSDSVVRDRVIQLLYVQARMAARADSARDRSMLSRALDDILLLAVGVEDPIGGGAR